MVKRGGGLIYFCNLYPNEGGGLIYFLFLYPNEGGGIGEGLKEKGAKYRNYSTSIPSFLSLPKHAGEGATAGVKALIAMLIYCMLCTW